MIGRRAWPSGSRVSYRIAIVLLMMHAVLLLASIRRTFITVDETMNVAAGVSYWQTGRFFIYRVNPPLIKMIAVLPALIAGPNADWSAFQDIPTRRAEFEAGLAFTNLNRSRIFELVCLARLAGVGWSILGGWLIFRWGCELYGAIPGCLALALWCFEPYIIGHAALVTTDVPAAVAGLAASYAYWKYLRKPSWIRAALSGVLLGVTSLTKFTLLILYPTWALLLPLGRPNQRANQGPAVLMGHLLLIYLVSLNLMNMGYAFRGSGVPLGDYPFISRILGGNPDHQVGNRFQGTWVGAVPVPLPEDFLRGIDVQRIDFEGIRSSYLGGTWARSGWWYYYLYSLALNTTALSLSPGAAGDFGELDA